MCYCPGSGRETLYSKPTSCLSLSPSCPVCARVNTHIIAPYVIQLEWSSPSCNRSYFFTWYCLSRHRSSDWSYSRLLWDVQRIALCRLCRWGTSKWREAGSINLFPRLLSYWKKRDWDFVPVAYNPFLPAHFPHCMRHCMHENLGQASKGHGSKCEAGNWKWPKESPEVVQQKEYLQASEPCRAFVLPLGSCPVSDGAGQRLKTQRPSAEGFQNYFLTKPIFSLKMASYLMQMTSVTIPWHLG